ncbi:hypothetical protein N7489_002528 [Penicillium chrysogenum]|uniref:Uncharacterized protein n=1 Tax=Penicillium chrysogenum TaxID=5076 RepID=A0ABQ8WM36_PENCH|nr:uncharacterized protein N7489_002528 [Penicillium chrysogenum]KAJ5248144.1 hypothetical protein N7524_012104 [Penicillium chrysogenum]KAJ5252118.1 hypothetical protein N7489_002528 [Penicillium chrysogenum]KAJ5271026.1 hypothetical protein N7505_006784 [Penicillium chrysogenum]
MDANGSIGMEERYTPIDSPGSWATRPNLCTIKSIIEDREAARTTHDNMGDEDMPTVYAAELKGVEMALQQIQEAWYGTVGRTSGRGRRRGKRGK